jgi:RimJ/RimL family protein N-acetyltransferase
MNLLDVEISTSRLLLKPISMEYKEAIFSEFTEEITSYTYPQPAKTIAETETFIQESLQGLQAGTNLQLVILLKQTQEFLGCAGLHNLDKQPELGIWLKKLAHGNRYGREAIAGIKQWAVKNINCDYLTYPVDKQNIASRKIPESLGGTIVRVNDKQNLAGNTLHLLEYQIPNR